MSLYQMFFDSTKQNHQTIMGACEQELELAKKNGGKESKTTGGVQRKERLAHGLRLLSKHSKYTRAFKPEMFNLNAAVPLGNGSFGDVYKCVHQTKGVVALKIFKDDTLSREPWKELGMLVKLRHIRICSVLGACYWGRACLILEYCIGTLLSLSELLTEPQNLRLFTHVLEGIRFMHSQDFIHADLKPSNILVRSNGCAVISDLGTCICLNGQPFVTFKFAIGTHCYMNEEALRNYRYSKDTDIWSAGCILFFLDKKKPLFEPEKPHNCTAKSHLDIILNGYPEKNGRVTLQSRIATSRYFGVLKCMITSSPASVNEILSHGSIAEGQKYLHEGLENLDKSPYRNGGRRGVEPVVLDTYPLQIPIKRSLMGFYYEYDVTTLENMQGGLTSNSQSAKARRRSSSKSSFSRDNQVKHVLHVSDRCKALQKNVKKSERSIREHAEVHSLSSTADVINGTQSITACKLKNLDEDRPANITLPKKLVNGNEPEKMPESSRYQSRRIDFFKLKNRQQYIMAGKAPPTRKRGHVYMCHICSRFIACQVSLMKLHEINCKKELW